MNAAEDFDDLDMDEENPRFSAAVRKRGFTDINRKSGDEVFDFEDVDAEPDSGVR
jgi:hypothetical protein